MSRAPAAEIRKAVSSLLKELSTYYFAADDPELAAVNRLRRLLGMREQMPKCCEAEFQADVAEYSALPDLTHEQYHERLHGGSTYLKDAIDAIPETTRDEVMLEVSESREQARMIDGGELKQRLGRRIFELRGHWGFPDYRRGKVEAYQTVLRWLDELEGRES